MAFLIGAAIVTAIAYAILNTTTSLEGGALLGASIAAMIVVNLVPAILVAASRRD